MSTDPRMAHEEALTTILELLDSEPDHKLRAVIRFVIRQTLEPPTADPITAARASLIDARLGLSDAIRKACSGPHIYRQHRDGLPAWCEACGYAEDGTRIREPQP